MAEDAGNGVSAALCVLTGVASSRFAWVAQHTAVADPSPRFRAIAASLRRHLAALSGTAQTTPASGPEPQGAITETAGRDASGVRTATGQSTSTGALTPGTGPASKAAQQALEDEQEQVLPFLVNTAFLVHTAGPHGAQGRAG